MFFKKVYMFFEKVYIFFKSIYFLRKAPAFSYTVVAQAKVSKSFPKLSVYIVVLYLRHESILFIFNYLISLNILYR